MSSSSHSITQPSDIREAFRLGRDAAAVSAQPIKLEPRHDGARRLALVPEGYGLQVLAEPAPVRGFRFTLEDMESFVRAVNTHKRPETAVTMARVGTGARLTAVLDFHPAYDKDLSEKDNATASPCRETVEWGLQLSDEAKAWLEIDNKPMSQVAFAEFLEDHAGAIVSPAQADVVEVARSLVATKGVNWKSGQRLTDGSTELVYSETVEAKAGQRGTVDIPETLTLGFEVWEGTGTVEVQARLRYRITPESLTFTVRFIRLAEVRSALLEEIMEHVEKETGLPVLRGALTAQL